MAQASEQRFPIGTTLPSSNCWATEETLDRRMKRALAQAARYESVDWGSLCAPIAPATNGDVVIPSGLTWTIAMTEANSEKLAVKWLRRRGFAAYTPTWIKILRKRATSLPVERCLFPRYIFVGQEPQRGRYVDIESTQGVSAVLKVRGLPVRVSEAVVANLRALELQACFVAGHDGEVKVVAPGHVEPKPGFHAIGSAIEIIDGPFLGRVGRVIREPENNRIQILIETFAVPIEINSDHLKINENGA